IYKGKITRIEPSLEAAFVNYGADRHGFLPLKEISSEYFINDVAPGAKPEIKHVLKEGQDIVVQIDKEERGNKGAALTTFVSLAGRFIVLKPNKSRSGGVSRRIVGEDRDVAREALQDVTIPDGMSVILRTAGIDRNAEELQWDLDNLLAVWEAIKKVVVERPSPFLIYRESNAVIRALRDYLSNDIGEILIDDEATFAEAKEFVEQVMPQNLKKLKLYTDAVPLFTRYQIETQIESAFAHSVTLPSGGSLVIDHTEALVSIDINSARATKGGDIEATALNTNLEAADEIGRQLRLRDLGGLVVIDFIDMGPQKNQREVENRLRDAVRQDRARVQIGKITRFGLLEMSRQRLRPSLGESSYMTCPRCSGIGNIRSVESLALAILRIIGEEARKERTSKVIAQLPVEVATYLLNEKRNWVQSLESRNDTQVILVANSALETPHYQIRRVRDDQVELPENSGTSYKLAELAEEPDAVLAGVQERKVAEPAAVATITPSTPAPVRVIPESKGPGLWSRLLQIFAGGEESAERSSRESSGRSGKKRDSRGGQRTRGRRSETQRGEPRSSRTSKTGRKRGGKGSAEDSSRPSRGSSQRSGTDKSSALRNAAENGNVKSAEDGGFHDKKQQDAPTRSDSRNDGRDDTRRAPGKRRSRGGRRRKRADSGETAEASENQQRTEAGSTDGPGKDEGSRERPSSRRRGGRNRTERTGESAPANPAAAERPAESIEPGPAAAATAGVQPTGGAGEWRQTPPPARPDERETAWSSYEDTQPELPVMRPAPADRKSAAEPGHARPAAEVTGFENAPASAPPDRRAEAEPAPGTQLKTNGAEETAKPGGRLLPWEPMTEPMRKTKAESEPEPARPEAAVAGKPLENVDRSESD
ncbi:MAG TPA: Rne/Rng family ribonuclease, partial [Woeseiaceae bacterium]|nr:Rne/Rng family ribonuclease [Woeseiaceae bacterium]